MTGPVEEMVWCRWEAAQVPADHHCVGVGSAPPPCPSPEGEPCGLCDRCLAAQEADLVRHGSPSDLDVPAAGPRPVAGSAMAYLADARVRVVEAHRAEPTVNRASTVRAFVRGGRGIYDVRGSKGAWLCPCTRHVMAVVADQCAHAASVALVTGWPSAAGPLHPEPTDPQGVDPRVL